MIATHKGEIPFIIFLLPFLAGICTGLYFHPAQLSVYLTAVFLSLGLTFVLLNLAYNRFNVHRFRWAGGLLIHLLLFLAGWISVINYNELNNPRHFSKNTANYLIIKINNEPKFSNGLLRFTAAVAETVNKNARAPATGTLLITIKDSLARNLYYGDQLLVPANYTKVDPPFNPGEFNYKQYLANQNIFYQSFLYKGQYVPLNINTGNKVVAYALHLRQQLIERLKTNMHDPQAIAVASTLILGYKADLSSEVLQAYSKTGTIHVLSVSGAHVAIIFILLNWALGFLNRRHYGKVIKAIIIILLIWYYSLLSGFSPAVCRAAVMISMIIIGKTYNRYINTLNILAASAFLLLLYNPLLITDVGFQLSYLAVGGLVVLQPVVYQWFTLKNKWADKLWALCSVSVAAQVITFPLSAFYFHQFPVYFLASNLFIIIPVTVIMYSGIAYFMLSWIPVLGKLSGYILEKSILLMNDGLALIENAPYSGISKIWLSGIEYLLLCAIIILLFCFTYYKKAWQLRSFAILIVLLAISISIKRWNALNNNSITFLNLRKHTGIVLKHGNEAIILTDLADTDKNYKYSVQPFLDSAKVSNLKSFALTQDINAPYVQKRNKLVQFGDKTLLLFDKHLQNVSLQQKLRVDYLYITGNPVADLQFINKNYQYKCLIVGADNSDRCIRQFRLTAEKKYNIIKRNFSLTFASN